MRPVPTPVLLPVVALSWQLLGCSDDSHPPILEPGSLGGSFQSGGIGGSESTDANPGTGGGTTSPGIVGGVALDQNDYVICSIESPVVVADLAVEESVARMVGFVNPVTDEMFYFLGGTVYGVEQGAVTPPAVCSAVDGFTMEPETGNLFFKCADGWYNDAETSISNCSGQLYIGYNSDLLCRTVLPTSEVVLSLIDRMTGTVLRGPITHQSYVEAIRSRKEGGFWYIEPNSRSLYSMTEEGDHLEYSYYDLPSGWAEVGQTGLSPDLTLYQLALKQSNLSMGVVARTKDASRVVWTDQGSCTIRGGVGGFLFYP